MVRDKFTRSKGFTLIELIIVIVILGIISVVAAPRFIDISDDALKTVSRAVMVNTYDATKMFHYKWHTSGRPNQLLIGDDTIEFSAQGYPIPSSNDSQGCADLFNEIVDGSISMEALDMDREHDNWAAWGNSAVCAYFNLNGKQLTSANVSEVPYFVYYTTGDQRVYSSMY